MIEINSISKAYADKELFNDLSLYIYDGERVGIIGANGAGKTTLIRIIAGDETPDKGYVKTFGENIGYLKQITEYTQEDFINVCNDQSTLNEFLRLSSLLNIDKTIEFTDERIKSLSGGERTKLMLAGILSQNPSILILDEPTNHLDQEGIKWLQTALNNYTGTVITISHDRSFLNAVVDKIIEIENGKVEEYYGDYDQYKRQKDQEIAVQKQKYEAQKQQEKILNKQIGQLNSWASKAEADSRRQGGMMSDSRIKGAQTKAQVSAAKLASAAKAKISRLEQSRENAVDRPYEEGVVHYRLEAEPIKTKVLIKATNVSKQFGDNILFKNADFYINAGEKVALRGKNGSGKTTLIKMLLDEDKDYSGEIWKTSSLKVSYLSQDVLDLDEEQTVMELARSGPDKEYTTLFLSNLVNMNMQRQVFDRKIKTLSLGERMRVKMCELILSDFNMIILDEPTNHLDLPNKIFLEKILKDYNGALLLVSHDKTFVDNICDQELLIENKQVKKKELIDSHEIVNE